MHYHFRTPDQFDAMVAEGTMLEWATVFGKSYGTPRAPVEAALHAGRDVVFDIDWQGHRQLRRAHVVAGGFPAKKAVSGKAETVRKSKAVASIVDPIS